MSDEKTSLTAEEQAMAEDAMRRIRERRKTFVVVADDEDEGRRGRKAAAPMPEEPAFADLDGMLARVRATAAAAKDRFLAGECPKCASATSGKARACQWNDAEWCKHAKGVAAANEADERANRRRENLEASGLRNRFVLDTFPRLAKPPAPPVSDPALAYLAGEPMTAAERFLRYSGARVLLLCGSPGTGKTWAAAWVVAARGGLWLDTSSIQPDDEWSAQRRAAERARLVVLNDLGAGAPSPWRDSEVEALVVSLHDACTPLVVTTNLGPERIRERYGDRVNSRLTGEGSLVQKCVGPDLRRGGGR